jgi:hypothetical protein
MPRKAELCHRATPRKLSFREIATGFNLSVNRQLNDEPDF